MPHGFLLSNDDEQYFNHVNGVCIVVVLTISAFLIEKTTSQSVFVNNSSILLTKINYCKENITY